MFYAKTNNRSFDVIAFQELAKSAGDSDVKSLVSAVVSGVLAGTSAGSSTASKGGHQHKDTYYAPTTYGQYSKPVSDLTKNILHRLL